MGTASRFNCVPLRTSSSFPVRVPMESTGGLRAIRSSVSGPFSRSASCVAFTFAISVSQSVHRAATSASCLLWLKLFGHDDRTTREEVEWAPDLLSFDPLRHLAGLTCLVLTAALWIGLVCGRPVGRSDVKPNVRVRSPQIAMPLISLPRNRRIETPVWHQRHCPRARDPIWHP